MKKTFLLLILIVSVQPGIAQPIIGIGKSKYFIASHMKGSPDWTLVKESSSELKYSDGKTSFTYSFLKDTPGKVNRTCTRCMAEFSDSAQMESYLDKKVRSWKLKPHPDMLNLIVVTDLYNDTIQAVVVGNNRILFSY